MKKILQMMLVMLSISLADGTCTSWYSSICVYNAAAQKWTCPTYVTSDGKTAWTCISGQEPYCTAYSPSNNAWNQWSSAGNCVSSSSSSLTGGTGSSSSNVSSSSSLSSSSVNGSSSLNVSSSSANGSPYTINDALGNQSVSNSTGIVYSNTNNSQVNAQYTSTGLLLNSWGPPSTSTTIEVLDKAIVTPDSIVVGGYMGQTKITQNVISTGSLYAATMVTTPKWHVPDFVFDKNYKQMPLNDVEMYVKSEHHLPGIPSESEIKKNGLDLAQMNLLLLQKIEEMTLSQIEMKKELESQANQIKALVNQKDSK